MFRVRQRHVSRTATRSNAEQCLVSVNHALPDADGDGISNRCDLCPNTVRTAPIDADGCARYQVDVDDDGVCFGPGQSTSSQWCPGGLNDNCPYTPNPLQQDSNNNGVGDACDPTTIGSVGPCGVDSDGDAVGDACEYGKHCGAKWLQRC